MCFQTCKNDFSNQIGEQKVLRTFYSRLFWARWWPSRGGLSCTVSEFGKFECNTQLAATLWNVPSDHTITVIKALPSWRHRQVAY